MYSKTHLDARGNKFLHIPLGIFIDEPSALSRISSGLTQNFELRDSFLEILNYIILNRTLSFPSVVNLKAHLSVWSTTLNNRCENDIKATELTVGYGITSSLSYTDFCEGKA